MDDDLLTGLIGICLLILALTIFFVVTMRLLDRYPRLAAKLDRLLGVEGPR